MVKKAKTGNGPFMFNIFFNLVTLGIAVMVVRFMNDLATDPQCKAIDPMTREGITGYSWLIIFLSGASALLNLYIIAMV